ncbi:MAG: DUF302 domain-containing protein [Anaerolineaceae bacterium]|nr:DUF302 domain-containing protein [Anaerolineaceae bacterium]
MIATQPTIGLTTYLRTDFDTAQKRVVDALKGEGFGVLTEIDIKDTFKKKLDIDFRPYKIFGACNPAFAHRALTAAPEVGLLLPCNVTIAVMEDDQVQVSIVDPLVMMGVISNNALKSVATEVRERLQRVIKSLEG